MSRRLRFLPPGSLVEVTSRTLQGRLLLQPNSRIADLCRGVLARAVRLYPIEVHAFAFLGNHYHLLLSAHDSQRLAAFMNYLNSNLAREIGRAVSWREKFWGRRYQAIVVSDEEPAQVERLLYILRQGTKEGLVRRPGDWPGATSVRALLSGAPVAGTWIDRTSEFLVARTRKRYDPRTFVSTESFDLTPLPCWRDVSCEEYRRRMRELVRGVEQENERRMCDLEREPMGVERLARQNPHDTPARSRRSFAPFVHAATAATRRKFRSAYRAFYNAYSQASAKHRARPGCRDRFELFPENSFPPPGPFLAAT
ncbi:MAG: transposase [Thermoanaerobaculia bacterium]